MVCETAKLTFFCAFLAKYSAISSSETFFFFDEEEEDFLLWSSSLPLESSESRDRWRLLRRSLRLVELRLRGEESWLPESEAEAKPDSESESSSEYLRLRLREELPLLFLLLPMLVVIVYSYLRTRRLIGTISYIGVQNP